MYKTIKWFNRTKESKNSLKVFFFFSKLDFVRIYPERETANVSWNEISDKQTVINFEIFTKNSKHYKTSLN